MAEETYEILALFMRFVFVFLGALILLRSYRWLRKDAKAFRRELKNLPDAGLVGEMVDLVSGESYPLPREGLIGSSRMCDIRLSGGNVAPRHATFLFEEGKGLTVTPLHRHPVFLDGEMIAGSGCALHGTRLEIGTVTLRVRLFAGLNVPQRAVFSSEEADFDPSAPIFTQEDLTEDWQAPDADDAEPEDQAAYPPQQAGPYWTPGQEDSPEDSSQMTWPYAPYPPEMLERLRRKPLEEDQAQGEMPQNDAPEEQDDYAPPFAQETPRTRRRRSRHER